MSDLRKAARLALHALWGWNNHGEWVWPESALESLKRDTPEAIAALEAALAAPPEVAQPQLPADGEAKDLSQVSDGYHTFSELYEHRHSLMFALMRAVPELCWFSQRHADGELPFGSDEWFIAGAELSTGSITYHLPISMLSLARRTGAAELPVGRPWDGHTASDVVRRLQAWAGAVQPQPNVVKQEVPACWQPMPEHPSLPPLNQTEENTNG